ncbi:uncharacterized protein [Nicotiana sylvestris]|uniref:uncharacterized protein n=1 Tax=Nicotiana sylvestris TaxID=4096 RepID=UPI00388CD7E5
MIKKVETYNFRVDQILGVPPVLKGLDAKKFIQKPFPQSAAPTHITKNFCMPYIPKYNGKTDPNEHITSYTYGIKGNDLNDDEIESVLLKKFGETLSKGAMIWYHNLPPNSIDSFAMLADFFVKAHTGAIKVDTRKSNVFKIKQRNNEMLKEFVSRFQMERIELPPVSDDWAVQAFMQGLNERSSIASRQLKQNLIEYPAVTWSDVHNCYQSKIRVEDDQLGATSGSVHLNRFAAKPPRDADRESRSNKERRPWIHNMRAVPSTLNQMLKFPTEDGVKKVYGEQHTAKKMFVVDEVTLIPEPSNSEKLNTKESDATKSTIEELEQVILVEYLPQRKI